MTELADAIDDLLERLEASFAAQRRFVANASHELRTPLTTLRASVDVAMGKPEPVPRRPSHWRTGCASSSTRSTGC
ncbi:histidine kinase dimerization/phospho-acceptor domain-containing protein [Oerskovia sp. M15]